MAVAGSGFNNRVTRLKLDGAVVAEGFRARKDGTFHVGVVVAKTPKSQTLTAEQQAPGGKWSVVARLSPLLTFTPPSGADTTPPVITNVTATALSSTSERITWNTNEPANTVLDYGTTGAYGTNYTNAILKTSHSVDLTGLVAATSSSFAEVLANLSPTAWWRLGEASGTLVDNIGTADATAVNTPTYGTTTALGDGDDGMTFANASAEYLTVTHQSSLNLGDVFTIGFRFARTGGGGGNVRHVMGKAGGVTYGVMFGNDDTLRLIAADGSNFAIVETTTAFTDTDEHLAIITKNGVNRFIYIDGVDVSDPGTNTTLVDTSGDLRIGAYATSTTNSFDGMLDEVFLIAGTAITQASVTALTDAQPEAGGAGQTYHYRIKATDAAGNLTTSSDYTFDTMSPNPTTSFTNIVATVLDATTVSVAWSCTPASTGQVQYGLTTAYGQATVFESDLLSSHTQVISGLTAGGLYHFRVLGTALGGTTTYSSDRTFTVTGAGANPPANLQAAINATAPGGTLNITGGVYTGGYTINKPMTLIGGTINNSTAQASLAITGQNVVIDGLTINGTGNPQDYGAGIWATGAHGLQVRNCTIHHFNYVGIGILNTHGGTIELNYLHHFAGQGASVEDNCYGIFFSDTGGGDFTRDMICQDNLIEDIPRWQGINTHNGKNLIWRRNTTYRVRRAYWLAPTGSNRITDCQVRNNYAYECDDDVSSGGAGYFIMNSDGCVFDGNYLSTTYDDAAEPDAGEYVAKIRDYGNGSTNLTRTNTTTGA